MLCRAVLVLSHAAGCRCGNAARGRSSTSRRSPVHRLGTYSAAKAWVTTFTEGLASELAGSGVTATALCPGFTNTEFQHEPASACPAPDFLWLEADRLVRDCLDDVAAGKVVSVPGLQYKVLTGVLQVLSRGLVRRAPAPSRRCVAAAAEVRRVLVGGGMRVWMYAEERCGKEAWPQGLSVVAATLASWRGPASRRTGRCWSRLSRCCGGAGPVGPGRVGPAGAVVRRARCVQDACRGCPGRGPAPGAVPRGRPGLDAASTTGWVRRAGPPPCRWRGGAGEGRRGGRTAREQAAGRGGAYARAPVAQRRRRVNRDGQAGRAAVDPGVRGDGAGGRSSRSRRPTARRRSGRCDPA